MPAWEVGWFTSSNFGIVKRAAEKRHHVMAAGAPAGGFHVAIALQRHLPRLAHAEQIRLVVERTEMMRAVEPALYASWWHFRQ